MQRTPIILWGMGHWLVVDASGTSLTNYHGDVTILRTSERLTEAEIVRIKKPCFYCSRWYKCSGVGSFRM